MVWLNERALALQAWGPGLGPQRYSLARKHLLHHHADKQTRIPRDMELLMASSRLDLDVPPQLQPVLPVSQVTRAKTTTVSLMVFLEFMQNLETCILLLVSSSLSLKAYLYQLTFTASTVFSMLNSYPWRLYCPYETYQMCPWII